MARFLLSIWIRIWIREWPVLQLLDMQEWTDCGVRWDPYEGYTGIASNQSAITHGTFFWHASREGCISKGTSVHGGLRTKLFVSLDS